MVRCGLGLYGYLPGRPVQDAFEAQAPGERLRPAMALKARVVAVRTLEAGERPSYGRRRPLPARSLVATVPIGYADGVPRALFDGGYEVLIGGVRRPLAGAVTMDQIVSTAATTTRCVPATRSCCSGGRGTRSSRPTTGPPCWGRSATRWSAASGPRMPRVVVNRPDG